MLDANGRNPLKTTPNFHVVTSTVNHLNCILHKRQSAIEIAITIGVFQESNVLKQAKHRAFGRASSVPEHGRLSPLSSPIACSHGFEQDRQAAATA